MWGFRRCRRSFWIVVVGLLIALPGSALAGCVISGNKIYPKITDVPYDSGGVISSVWHTGTMMLKCVEMYNGTYTNQMSAVGAVAGTSVVFEGVSYKLYKTNLIDVFYFGTFAVDNGAEQQFGSAPYVSSKVTGPGSGTSAFDLKALVKIRFYSSSKSLSSGVRNIDLLDLVRGDINYSTPGVYSGKWIMQSEGFSFVAKGTSCVLTTPAIVKLKQVSIVSIPAIGSTVEGGAFTLSLACNASAPSFKVSYAMTDVYNPANTSTVLTLADEPLKANGIALQLSDEGRAVIFSPPVKSSMGSLTHGALSKAMSVQYIRTEKVATPGKITAAVSVTFTYD
ncbi:fimbrial protein [Pseudomonas paralactis]|nr:fimbrial protein [Pseudomonas paralactis]